MTKVVRVRGGRDDEAKDRTIIRTGLNAKIAQTTRRLRIITFMTITAAIAAIVVPIPIRAGVFGTGLWGSSDLSVGFWVLGLLRNVVQVLVKIPTAEYYCRDIYGVRA